MDSPETTTEEEMSPEEARGWIEFGAWCALVMTPIIWWLQGPSVSTDQFYVRSALVVISFFTGLGMRIWAITEKRRPSQKLESKADQKLA